MDVTIACTYRDTDLTPRRSAQQAARGSSPRGQRRPGSRSAASKTIELVELFAAAAGHELDDDGVGLAHALRRETDGNPFFTAELLRHLGESGGIVLGDDGRWTWLASSTSWACRAAFATWSGGAWNVSATRLCGCLCLAAVIGREFDLGVLAQLADVDEDPLLDLLDAAVSAAVLVESGRRRPLPVRARAHPTQPLRRTQPDPPRSRPPTQSPKPWKPSDGDGCGELSPSSPTTGSPRPDPPTSTRPSAMSGAPATRPATRSHPTTPSAGTNKPSTSSPARPHPTNTNAPSSSPNSAPPNGRPHSPNIATRSSKPPTSPNNSTTPTSSSMPRSASPRWQRPCRRRRHQAGHSGRARPHRPRPDPHPRPAPRRARGRPRRSLEWQTRRDLSLEAVDIARRVGDDATFVDVIDITFAHRDARSPRPTHRRHRTRGRHGRSDRRPGAASSHQIPDDVGPVPTSRHRGRDAVLAEMEALTEMIGLPYQRWQLRAARHRTAAARRTRRRGRRPPTNARSKSAPRRQHPTRSASSAACSS